MTRFAVAERVLASLAAALFSLLALGGRPCHAGSTVTITDIQTWPAGVYRLEGLPIGPTGSLTLEPGCVLVFDTEESALCVEGELRALGDVSSGVVFTSAAGIPESCTGISVSSGGSLDLRYAEVLNAGSGDGYAVRVIDSTANFDHCYIAQAHSGMDLAWRGRRTQFRRSTSPAR